MKNVSASASAVDAIDHPVANKKVLAIATQRCEQSFFDGARIEFWDVTNPDSPSMMGTFDPESIPNPLCNPTCPGGVPPNGRWGIFEDVRMFTRNNGPGGSTKVYAVATSPFSIGNSHDASPQGDFRLLDVTNPASVQQIDTFPKTSISSEPQERLPHLRRRTLRRADPGRDRRDPVVVRRRASRATRRWPTHRTPRPCSA